MKARKSLGGRGLSLGIDQLRQRRLGSRNFFLYRPSFGIAVSSGGLLLEIDTLDAGVYFLAVQGFELEQSFRDANQRVPMHLQDGVGAAVSFLYDPLYFLVDLYRSVLAVVPVLGDLASQEDLFFLFAKR